MTIKRDYYEILGINHDALWGKKAMKSIWISIFLLIILGCQKPFLSEKEGTQTTKPLKFTTIEKGYYSGHINHKNLVIKNETIWGNVWKAHSDRKAPPINFTKEMVIAVFRGQCPTGGYAIEITRIERRKDKIMVNIVETDPDPESMVIQVLTQPYHIVKIERSALPVKFSYRKERQP